MAHAVDIGTTPRTGAGSPHSPWFLPAYAAAGAALSMALFTPIVVTLPLRVTELVPAGAGTAGPLGLMLSAGAAVALVSTPLFGRLSDRTRSRWGRRRPWLVGGAAWTVAGLFLAGSAPTVPGLVLAWCLTKLGFSAVMAALLAVLSDRVPPTRRGFVSGLLGVCFVAGPVAGTVLVDLVPGRPVLMLVLPAAVCLLAMLALSAVLPDRTAPPDDPEPTTLRALARTYWVSPRRHPDFAWAWLSRLFFGLGLGTLLAYQAFFLMDRFDVDRADLPRVLTASMIVQSTAVVLSSLVSGRLSDRSGRRRVFVFTSALVYAGGLLVVALAGSFTVFLVGMAVAGVGQGVYLSVELALVTDVLPDRDHDAAKDLGVFNLATAIPQSLAPALAPLVLAVTGGSYTVLFAVAGLYAALGALAIRGVHGVR